MNTHPQFFPRLTSAFARTLAVIAALAASGQVKSWGQEGETLGAQEMAAKIDEMLLTPLRQQGIQPAPRSTDAEFLRRAYLDLTGVTPRVAQVRKFLGENPAEETNTQQRAQLIEELLQSPGHATHLANRWRNTMLGGGQNVEQFNNVVGVQNWLRRQFMENMRYDRIVGDLLTSSSGGDAGPALFFTALETSPEKIAAATSRIFLGVQMECAQCHDHPFDHWKQTDFWGYAAFFARLESANNPGGVVNVADKLDGEVTLPESEDVVSPKYPEGPPANPTEGGTRRRQLAIWMASRDNPYLARAAVNRVWAHLFGRGIVEPVDDMGPNNPPSHPELLNALADYFVRTGFDVQQMYRTLALTQAYQRTSRTPESLSRETRTPAPPETFARMAVKPLSAEQLYDSLGRIVLRQTDAQGQGPFNNRLFNARRLVFLTKMEALQSRSGSEYQAGVPQALTLMNGADIAEGTDFSKSALLEALEAPWFSTVDRVETLFLTTLSRPPSQSERELFTEHVRSAGEESGSERSKALGDVLWALLNSAEFAMNH